MKQQAKGDARARAGNIDQIRELMFGSQMREYDGRFEQLESDLSNFHEETRKRIDEVNNNLSDELRVAVESLERKIKELGLTTQEQGTDLRQQIERTDSKFTQRLESLSEEVNANATALREELSQARGKLQEDIQGLKTQVFNELNKQFSTLGEVKVSKDDMAEILFEVGMRIKGAELIPELEGVDILEAEADEADTPEKEKKGK